MLVVEFAALGSLSDLLARGFGFTAEQARERETYITVHNNIDIILDVILELPLGPPGPRNRVHGRAGARERLI